MSPLRWSALACVAGVTMITGFVWFRGAGVEYQPFADGELVGYYERSKNSQTICAVHAWFRTTGTLHLRANYRAQERTAVVWDRNGFIQRETRNHETRVSPPWSDAARAISPDQPMPTWLTSWLQERSAREEAHRHLIGSAGGRSAIGASLR